MNKTNHEFVNPQNSYKKIYIFPIHNALKEGTTEYEATRQAWKRNERLLKEPLGIAVGIKNKISVGVFEIQRWYKSKTKKHKWEFEGSEIDDLSMLNFNYSKIINEALGFWKRGNYLVVEFDGKSNFRFFYGNKDKQTWHSLL